MIEIENLHFSYPGSNGALLSVSKLSIAPGEKVMLRGPSGSGKSTLLNLIAGILKPQSGRVSVCGRDVAGMNESAARDFRANHIGFIFLDFALLDYLTVADNILLPYRINPTLNLDADVRARMARLLSELGIAHKSSAFPGKLSFGERQRAAIARAMITGPKTILADEPTANLDRANALKTIELIAASAARDHAGLVLVSHDETLDGYFDRVIDMAQWPMFIAPSSMTGPTASGEENFYK